MLSVGELKHLHNMLKMHICKLSSIRETKHCIVEVGMTFKYTAGIWMVLLPFPRRNSCFHLCRYTVLVRVLIFHGKLPNVMIFRKIP